MKKRKILLSMISCLLISVISCSEMDFSIYDTPLEDIAVTCIIDTRIDMNLVQVQKIYLTKKEKPDIGKIEVYLSDSDGKELLLDDTLITGRETCLFYKIPKNILQRGSDLRLSLVGDKIGRRHAVLHYFKNPGLGVRSELFGEIPGVLTNNIYFTFTKELPGAFLYRLFIEYEELINNKYEKKMAFVPEGFVPKEPKENWSIVDYKTEDLVVVQSRITTIENYTGRLSVVGDKYIYFYDGQFVHVVMRELAKNNKPENIRIKGIFAVLYQIDLNYYYNYMQDQNEKFSIRIDERVNLSNFYSNSEQKYGLFSTIAVDTIRGRLQDIYIEKLKYVNAQE